VVIGRGEVLDAADNIVLAESGLVALLGVRGLVAVQAGGVTLVCAKERVQDVKRLVAQVGRRPGGGAWL